MARIILEGTRIVPHEDENFVVPLPVGISIQDTFQLLDTHFLQFRLEVGADEIIVELTPKQAEELATQLREDVDAYNLEMSAPNV